MKERARPISRIAAPIRGAAQRFAYLGLVMAAFAAMMLGKADVVLVERFRTQITDALTPMLDALARPTATIAEMVRTAREISNLHEENLRLREESGRLLQWQAAARKLEAENKALRDLLHFSPDGEIRFVTARVIGNTGGAFARSLLLNAGQRDGVRKGQVVVSGQGLVGRITSVGRHSSRVLLLTDLNSRVPVVVEPTRTRAMLAGNNSDQANLLYLPPGAEVSPGDRVVTSGHAGVFPPGLPVGVVSAVSEAGISVRPLVDRDRLEYLRIVDYGLKGILTSPADVGDEDDDPDDAPADAGPPK
ncbi:MAG: rod shape-determining protein MreC [Magnetospirillum sp. WYHS-4]